MKQQHAAVYVCVLSLSFSRFFFFGVSSGHFSYSFNHLFSPPVIKCNNKNKKAVDDSYSGMHMPEPITIEFVKELMEEFRLRKKIHKKYIYIYIYCILKANNTKWSENSSFPVLFFFWMLSSLCFAMNKEKFIHFYNLIWKEPWG